MIKQDVKECLRENYLPYAVSVITDRALPSIDGFKPSHRKLLYTMYKMGLLKGSRTKSANIVGQTMKLNPHGDGAIYETLVRLTKNNESLLLPYIDSKGNFGKIYSRDMAYAASRYTEARLLPISEELFKSIDNNVVDMVDNYDGKMKEPTLLPVTFPSLLTNVSMGIAVSMASNICSFNLSEVCDYTIDYLNNTAHANLVPDFSTGGELIMDNSVLDDINNVGRGGVKIHAKYEYDKENNCIDVNEIPYTTNVESIIDKVEELVKSGKVKEITDIRDETDLKGVKITIDIKKNVNPDTLMQKLFKMTPLEDTFSCNFNILINGKPQVLGVKSIISHWVDFRKQCIKRELEHDVNKLQEECNRLIGLELILFDLDKAIELIRSSKTEQEAMDKLESYFKLNQAQLDYVCSIKLINMNSDWLKKKTSKLGDLTEEMNDMRDSVSDDSYYTQTIISQLQEIKSKYGKPRLTTIIHEDEVATTNDILIPDETCAICITKDGYVKRTQRQSATHKLKDGDIIILNQPCTTKHTILLFTNKGNVHKVFVHTLDQTLPSNLGQYLYSLVQMDKDEKIISVQLTRGYKGYLINVFENNKLAKVNMSSFQTEQKRTTLKNAISLESPLIAQYVIETDIDILVQSTIDKCLIVNTSDFNPKNTKSVSGDSLIKSKNDSVVKVCHRLSDIDTTQLDVDYYRGKRGNTGVYVKKTNSINIL